MPNRTLSAAILCASLVLGAPAAAQDRPAAVRVDPDGTVHVPEMTLPPSEYLTPEGKAYLAEHLINIQNPAMLGGDPGSPPLIMPYLERQKALYPVDREDTTIAGVHAYVYTPQGGVPAEHQDRVLINLHGGGFSGCWPACAELESIPIAALGRVKVVAVDYRQGPEHKFPAASEDVAAVYRELLKTYAPEKIGIYGCSAGGMLAGMAIAWFLNEGLPVPGAAGILCAGLTTGATAFGGDAGYFTLPIGEGRAAPPPPAPGTPRAQMAYLAGTDPSDPLAEPGASTEVVSKFPPTLIVSGTRGFDLSAAVHADILLTKAGVESDLHIWDGMFHGFFYNPDVPESRDCYDIIVRFFDEHLGSVG